MNLLDPTHYKAIRLKDIKTEINSGNIGTETVNQKMRNIAHGHLRADQSLNAVAHQSQDID